jgi:hypothetical protein
LRKKSGWATSGAIFSQTFLVTLAETRPSNHSIVTLSPAVANGGGKNAENVAVKVEQWTNGRAQLT